MEKNFDHAEAAQDNSESSKSVLSMSDINKTDMNLAVKAMEPKCESAKLLLPGLEVTFGKFDDNKVAVGNSSEKDGKENGDEEKGNSKVEKDELDDRETEAKKPTGKGGKLEAPNGQLTIESSAVAHGGSDSEGTDTPETVVHGGSESAETDTPNTVAHGGDDESPAEAHSGGEAEAVPATEGNPPRVVIDGARRTSIADAETTRVSPEK